MNHQEMIALIGALKSSGALHFKSDELEITFNKDSYVEKTAVAPIVSEPAQTHQQVKANEEATRKIQALIKTMSLPPEQLVDQIFPNGAGG